MGTRIALLLRRRDLIELLGTNNHYINKLVSSGALQEVKPFKNGKSFFRRDDIEKIFGVKLTNYDR